jgi:cell division transport system permease protein
MSKLPNDRKKRRKRNLGSYPSGTVVFTITLALFVMGLCGLLLLQGKKLVQTIQENIEVYVYLDNFLTAEQLHKTDSLLRRKPYVLIKNDSVQVQFISKDVAAQRLIAGAGEDYISFLGENPLRDGYVLKIKPEFYQNDKIKEVRDDLEKTEGVFEAEYAEVLIDNIQRNLGRIAWFLVGFTLVLLLAIVILINNTIRLAMFSQRFLVRSMQLVGATQAFIQRPFLIRAGWQGLLSGVLASGMLLLLIPLINLLDFDETISLQLRQIGILQDWFSVVLLFGILCVLGLLIGTASAYLAVRRYLQSSLDELY